MTVLGGICEQYARIFFKMSSFRTDLIAELPYLRRFARGLCGDASVADDLVQDCVERALAKSHLYDPARPLRAWLYAVLRNVFVSNWRRDSKFKSAKDIDDLSGFEGAVAADQESNMSVSLISKALDTLPSQQREVLVLISLEEMSYAQAAEIIGVPIGTIMSRLSRARAHLQIILEERGTTVLRRVK
jgi:RNA polymerase sigma-70 factor (ECF subfamily)